LLAILIDYIVTPHMHIFDIICCISIPVYTSSLMMAL